MLSRGERYRRDHFSPVVSGNDLEAAIYATEELEETAKLFLLLRNTPTNCLNSDQIAEVKSVFKLDF